jgi:D-tyrosyl-tRNA(Tyr) deacylase
MRAVVQRVRSAKVTVAGEVVGEIGLGLLVLVGAEQGDSHADVEYLVEKIINLRIFPDANDQMNLSLKDVAGALLGVSQFTLLGDTRKGRRPSFIQAMAPEPANLLYEHFLEHARQSGIPVASGRFRADMDVSLVNYGPVTLLLDSKKAF